MTYSIVVTLIAVLSVWQVVQLVEAEANEIIEPVSCPTLAEQLEARAYEIREDNKEYDLEKYRHEAIREINIQLQDELEISPFMDLQELHEQNSK